jgi:hypothetical protein
MAHRFVCWRSSYSVSFEDCVNEHSTFSDDEKCLIIGLVNMYLSAFDWAGFQLLRIGDSKITIILQKDPSGLKTIKVSLI